VPDLTSPEPPGGGGARSVPSAVWALSPGPALDALAFDAVPVALAVATLDGQWVRVNPALCELLGYRTDQLLGDTYRSITHPDDVRLDEEAAALLLERGRGPSIEKRYRHADGHLIWVRVTASLLRDPAGAPIGAPAGSRSRTSPNCGTGTRNCPGWRCTTR
jgi:PAS domain S-box-containing protein